MGAPIVQDTPDVELFARRFEVVETAPEATPLGTKNIKNDDTGTWRKDTEDRDT